MLKIYIGLLKNSYIWELQTNEVIKPEQIFEGIKLESVILWVKKGDALEGIITVPEAHSKQSQTGI